ncbi:uncharacterized protein I303_104835 [Kwoniella dejecticola CBS 10117]|uniref:Uncharacterized protein n=1 Tax=Kwoniella dejecticola CBS 10117 TaxID=1296121 RepID=A0A1A6A482_9TREE|nr:uncharacterized protein I303_04184 [Kwoniella dejecticola CBS 10117]OBR84863.1 hypothetical protein I303_04184 [Kwoniella dejecticola CBS 10117]
MRLLGFLPCCGHRKDKVKDDENAQEGAALLPPQREESIISADGLSGNYGATDQGLTDEQRLRIEAIGRQVGGHMLPINALPPGPGKNSPSLNRNTARAPSPSATSHSRESSRPSSPSPLRPETSPPDGVLRSPEKEDDGVVRKTLFAGGGGGTSNRKTSGRGKGKTRGKGRK